MKPNVINTRLPVSDKSQFSKYVRQRQAELPWLAVVETGYPQASQATDQSLAWGVIAISDVSPMIQDYEPQNIFRRMPECIKPYCIPQEVLFNVNLKELIHKWKIKEKVEIMSHHQKNEFLSNERVFTLSFIIGKLSTNETKMYVTYLEIMLTQHYNS